MQMKIAFSRDVPPKRDQAQFTWWTLNLSPSTVDKICRLTEKIDGIQLLSNIIEMLFISVFYCYKHLIVTCSVCIRTFCFYSSIFLFN